VSIQERNQQRKKKTQRHEPGILFREESGKPVLRLVCGGEENTGLDRTQKRRPGLETAWEARPEDPWGALLRYSRRSASGMMS
jgi:hypothetical protein